MYPFQAHLSKVRVPSTYDSVYKDECVYSFDTPVNCNSLFEVKTQ